MSVGLGQISELHPVDGIRLATGCARIKQQQKDDLAIIELCDGTRTNSDISKEINKCEGYVRASVSSLRGKGLIKTVKKEDKKIHEQRF